jgi:hypothetical protein
MILVADDVWRRFVKALPTAETRLASQFHSQPFIYFDELDQLWGSLFEPVCVCHQLLKIICSALSELTILFISFTDFVDNSFPAENKMK